MAACAKRVTALLAVLTLGVLGGSQGRAEWGDDPPPHLAPAAYTEDASPPPVGGSVVRGGARPAPRQQVAPAPLAPQSPVPKLRRPTTGANNARPTFRTTSQPGRPARVAQAPESIPPAAPEEQPATPIETMDDADEQGSEGLHPWDDELMANGPDALVYSSGEWMNDGCWFASADLLLMNRVNPKQRRMAVDTTAPLTDFLSPNRPPLNTDDGSFRIAPGIRTTIGYVVGRDWANRDQDIEFTYYGLLDWDKASGIQSSFPQRLYTPIDPGFLFIPSDVAPVRNAVFGGFAASDIQQYEYSSTLNSLELNFRTRFRLARDVMTAQPDGTWARQLDPGPTPSVFAGLRYFRITETLDWQSQRISNPALGQANLANATGDYDVETTNNLFGIQFGGDWVRQEKNWRLGGWIKLGGLVNFAQQHTTVAIDDNFFSGDFNRDEAANDEVFTFAGEAGVSGAYHFTPNVSLRGGLEMLWIQSVAVASEQLSFNFANPPAVQLSGNVFYMGASCGLEVIW